MVLNGDIMEYENGAMGAVIESGQVTAEDINLLLNFVNYVFFYLKPISRLRGGAPRKRARTGKEIALRQPSDVTITFTDADLERYAQLARDALPYLDRFGSSLVTTVRNIYDRVTSYGGNPSFRNDTEIVPYNYTGTNNNTNTTEPIVMSKGKDMLEWKNTLTRMYHTYHVYYMSVIKTTFTSNSLKLHGTWQGNGPALYWTYDNDTSTGSPASRNLTFGALTYWDGGMGTPTNTPRKRNYGLGSNGVVYVFAADWPGTYMNTDTATHSGGTGVYLEFTNYVYNQTTVNKNIPRKWDDTFNNTSWNYITVYGTQWTFRFTNYATVDYTVEISLFKFKADVDVMDYEKQCLAHFGGAQGGTNAYREKQLLAPVTDVLILKTVRYKIPGLTNNVFMPFNSTSLRAEQMVAFDSMASNTKKVTMNVKRRYVIKRPILTSYETNLTEKDIWLKYHDNQAGLYFRMQAWPNCQDIQMDLNTGVGTCLSVDAKNVPNATPAELSILPGLACTVLKKSFYKMDENAATF